MSSRLALSFAVLFVLQANSATIKLPHGLLSSTGQEVELFCSASDYNADGEGFAPTNRTPVPRLKKPLRVLVYDWEPNRDGLRKWPPYSIMPLALNNGCLFVPLSCAN